MPPASQARACSAGLPSTATPQQVAEANAVPQALHAMMLAMTQAITHSLHENLSPLVNSQAHLLAMVQQIGQTQTFQASSVDVQAAYLQASAPPTSTASPQDWEFLDEGEERMPPASSQEEEDVI